MPAGPSVSAPIPKHMGSGGGDDDEEDLPAAITSHTHHTLTAQHVPNSVGSQWYAYGQEVREYSGGACREISL